MSSATLRFSRQLYAGEAIDAAVKRLDAFATFELSEQDEHFVVAIVAKRPPMLRRIVGELQNHALGLTIRRGGVA